MRPPRQSPWLSLTSLFLLKSPHIFAQPTNHQSAVPPPNERDLLSDLLDGSSALGNLTDDIGNLVGDAASLLTAFIGAVQEFTNATNENGLVELLGLDLKGDAEDDDEPVSNTTIGAVGANAICPGIAVLFARGTAEPGKQPPHPHIVTTIKA